MAATIHSIFDGRRNDHDVESIVMDFQLDRISWDEANNRFSSRTRDITEAMYFDFEMRCVQIDKEDARHG